MRPTSPRPGALRMRWAGKEKKKKEDDDVSYTSKASPPSNIAGRS
jgi:hypothetical protein